MVWSLLMKNSASLRLMKHFLSWQASPVENVHEVNRSIAGLVDPVSMSGPARIRSIPRLGTELCDGRARCLFRGGVEVSAAFIGGEPLLLGFCMHALTQPRHYETEQATPCPGDRIRKRVGQSSLKQLVQEATDKIERQSIEVALDLTCNNRASAAHLLGLSRQSLYTKLRRYGLYSPSKPANRR